jgi:endonuclease/exonuclease/phosphatase family metal-dependent hydrolase
VAAIVALAARFVPRAAPLLVMGDMNALSPSQEWEHAQLNLSGAFRKAGGKYALKFLERRHKV